MSLRFMAYSISLAGCASSRLQIGFDLTFDFSFVPHSPTLFSRHKMIADVSTNHQEAVFFSDPFVLSTFYYSNPTSHRKSPLKSYLFPWLNGQTLKTPCLTTVGTKSLRSTNLTPKSLWLSILCWQLLPFANSQTRYIVHQKPKQFSVLAQSCLQILPAAPCQKVKCCVFSRQQPAQQGIHRDAVKRLKKISVCSKGPNQNE